MRLLSRFMKDCLIGGDWPRTPKCASNRGAEGLAGRLKPAPPTAKVAAASENQQRDEYEKKKCRRVHDALLRTCEPSRVHLIRSVNGRSRSEQVRNLLTLSEPEIAIEVGGAI
jgi:hypothetical protein